MKALSFGPNEYGIPYQVCCRVRPLTEVEATAENKVMVEALSEFEVGYLEKKTGHTGWRSFAFDRVWGPQNSQEDVFVDVEPLALSTVEGSHACIFAYGQTGSGKTYTMQGSNEGQEYGISYRVMSKMLDLLNLRVEASMAANDCNGSVESVPTFHYELQLSMIEVYNEEVHDLLRSSGPAVNMEIRKDADGILQVGILSSLHNMGISWG